MKSLLLEKRITDSRKQDITPIKGVDIDTLLSSYRGRDKNPWWIIDVDKPTVEIDWQIMQRYKEPDVRSRQIAISTDHFCKISSASAEPYWKSNPEDNSILLSAFAELAGINDIKFIEINSKTKKLIFEQFWGKTIDFSNLNSPYETKNRISIPLKYKWAICFLTDGLSCGKTMSSIMEESKNKTGDMLSFLSTLGYGSISGIPSAVIGFGTVAGLGELGRHNRMISPQLDLAVQNPSIILTDFPLLPSRAMDAGIRNFCRECKYCAYICPEEVINPDTEPTWDVANSRSTAGLKHWHTDEMNCRACWYKISKQEDTQSTCGACYNGCYFSNRSRFLDLIQADSTVSV